MTKTFSKTKAAALLTAICMLVSVFASFGCVNASAATANVSLYFSDTYSQTTDELTRIIYVKTDGSNSNQQVYVHYDKTAGQAWADEQAEYFKTLDDGSKLWKATIVSDADHTEYVIKYVANGHTYWDNNGGSNYSGTADNDDLGSAPFTVVRPLVPSYYFSSFVTVKLHNYAYQKNVFIRYTLNGWRTYTDVPMSYDSTNSDGTETWKGTIRRSPETSNFQYCVCYEVNGQTYWANNFGENYNYEYRVIHN